MASKKELRYAFKEIKTIIQNAKCEDFSHNKNQYHDDEHMCPIVYDLNRHLYLIEELIKPLIK